MKTSFDAIESLIHEHRVSKTEIARIAGVGPSAVTKWAQGGAIREHHLVAIARHFGVSLDSLCPCRGQREGAVREHPPGYGAGPALPLQTSCRIPANCDLPHELADMKAQLATLSAQVDTLTRLLGAALAGSANTNGVEPKRKTG